MTGSITGNPQADMKDRVNSIRYHLDHLQEAVDELPSTLAQAPTADPGAGALVLFANWTLDLLGFSGEGKVSDQVHRARRQLVAVMALAGRTKVRDAEQEGERVPEFSQREFEDLFADGWDDDEEPSA